jgi:hypothetical protein
MYKRTTLPSSEATSHFNDVFVEALVKLSISSLDCVEEKQSILDDLRIEAFPLKSLKNKSK